MDRSSDGSSDGTNLLEIIDLAHSLRQEHLYITNEQKMFRTLNATLQTNSANVAQLAWICAQQRQNLNSLIVSRADSGPSVCCHKATQLANTTFIDAHKARGVKYQHVLSYIELFNFLHRSPYLLAQSLAVGDRDARLSSQHMSSVVHTIVSGLYGNAILSKDVDMLLRLLRELIEIQIVVADDPRRLLRSGASAFSRLYHRLHESLFSAKLFLTSALHESIMRVLIEDDQPLDVDPLRTIAGLPPDERARRFGLEGTGEYRAKCAQFRAATLRKLHLLAAGCIQSLLDNWTLFPSTLRWVVQTMCHLLRSAHIAPAEINHILTDMVFTHFICPAVVSPDLFGISDAPVSENARHNLIQIGQVMQMLALTRHEAIDARFAELLGMFETNVVAALMEQLQETEYDVSVSMMAIPHQNDFGRDAVLVTQSELNVFVGFLRGVLEFDGLSVSGEDRRKLGSILDQLPDRWETVVNGAAEALQLDGAGGSGGNGANRSPTKGATTAAADSPGRSNKQTLIALGKTTKTRLAKTMSIAVGGSNGGEESDNASPAALDDDAAAAGWHQQNNNNTIGLDEPYEQVLIIPIAISDESKFQLLTEQEVLNMNNISTNKERGAGAGGGRNGVAGHGADGAKLKVKRIGDEDADVDDDEDDDDDDDDDDEDDDDCGDVMRAVGSGNPAVGVLLMRGGCASASAHHHHHGGRLPLLHDDQSIGNASDNLEAVSEVPSNHSVTSSVEMEEHYQHLNDNLSDMVSANVSGRGSPNISGRDTPSSQVTDGGGLGGGAGDVVGDDASSVGGGVGGLGVGGHGGGRPSTGAGAGGGLPNSVQMAKMLNKTRSDIDDKFCKFEISKRTDPIDETVSIISDTWSTDVLASDSETLEPSDRNFTTPLIPSAVVLPGDRDFEASLMQLPQGGLGGNAGGVGGGRGGIGSAAGSLFDASETRSESAWSTDVLASDSEKLIEIDTDDNNSVTAMSDAGGPTMAMAGSVTAAVLQPRRLHPPELVANGSSAATGASNGVALAGRVRISSDDLARFMSNGPANAVLSSAAIAGTSSAAAAAASRASCSMPGAVMLPSIGAYGPPSKPLSCMRRQNSAESSISTHSSTNDMEPPIFGNRYSAAVAVAATSASLNGVAAIRSPYAGARVLKTDTNIANPFADRQQTAGDEVDGGGAGSGSVDSLAMNGGRSGTNSIIGHDETEVAEEEDQDESDLLNAVGDVVEHRAASASLRSTSYDGRRNGIMSTRQMESSSNYENHEIIFKTRAASLNDASASGAGSPITDDDKSARRIRQQQQQLNGNGADGTAGLCGATMSLSLEPAAASDGDTAKLAETAAAEAIDENGSVAVALRPSAAAASSAAASRYTGTIPKSISFDESANKRSSRHNSNHHPSDHHHHHHAHNNHNHHHRHHRPEPASSLSGKRDAGAATANGGGGAIIRHTHGGNSFFNKLRQGFRNRRSHYKSSGAGDREAGECGTAVGLGAEGAAMHLEAAGAAGATGNGLACIDGGDDILAKYRRKISSSSEATNSDSLGNRQNSQTEVDSGADMAASLDETPLLLNNAKRKLRLVLSTTDLHTADFRHTSSRKIPPLMTYLQIQLAQALNLQHLQQIAFISETIRCLRQLDDAQQRQLIADLQQDLIKRQSYLQYLMRYRQHLLSALENIDRFEDRLRNDRDQCNRHLIMVCVRLFLEKRQGWVERFQTEFGGLTVVDEKIDCMEEFMGKLMAELMEYGVLQGMTQWQRQEARAWIERALLQKLYRQVMFPNDDADVSRDEVLRIHIDKLSRLITPAHPSLRIPHEYRVEAPWPFAQQQIAYISAYKTPREKVQCVVRCITSIMNLLQMACSRSPAADDLVPVLIYVVIKANPPYLMSTIQYVNAFIGNELEGEDHYWWTQFSAAVTFIKTMDYNH